jgi:hypothetical protein
VILLEHYALTVLKAEKARLEYELFEIEKFNQSVLPHRMIWEASQDIYIHPAKINRIREKLKEINEAIQWMEGRQ